MAGSTRMSVQKRMREQKKAEKAAQKREQKKEKKEPGAADVASASDLEAYGAAPAPFSDSQQD